MSTLRERFNDIWGREVAKPDGNTECICRPVTVASILALVESEIQLDRARIVTWLRGAPERMAEQSKNGAQSIGALYDCGQLAAIAQTADCIEQGKVT
jgi:hypothetical protein